MSLDFYLTVPGVKKKKETSGIFISKDGMRKEISLDEWDEMYPDREPVVFVAEEETEDVFEANITHNLTDMASFCGIYECLWKPDKIGATKARDIIDRLENGVELMEGTPHFFKQFDDKNGWGTYDQFLPWVKNVLAACKENPDATIDVSV